MKKICVLGNSHVGALKQAYDTMKKRGDLADVEITIFGSHAETAATCRVANGVIHSNDADVRENFSWTSEGNTEIDLSKFTMMVVCAGFSIFSTRAFWGGNPEYKYYDLPPVSDTLAKRIYATMADRWDIRLAKDAAAAKPDLQVVHLGIPFRSEEHPNSISALEKMNDPRSTFKSRVIQLQAGAEVAASDMATKNFHFLKPPAEVLEDHGLFTRHSFCRGSMRLTQKMDTQHPEDDYGHMNAAYGERIIATLLH